MFFGFFIHGEVKDSGGLEDKDCSVVADFRGGCHVDTTDRALYTRFC